MLAVAVSWRLGGAAGGRREFLKGELGSVVDVLVILQLFQKFFGAKVPQIQFIDRVVACSCATEVATVQTVLKTAEIPQVLFVKEQILDAIKEGFWRVDVAVIVQ